ncbi:MAG: Rne/Rng family ribonuclease [Acidobacteriota bacterium]
MSKELIISITPQETKAAILENAQVVEIHIERSRETGIVGSICKGRVTKVLPGMQSAFVDIGLERDAFLYVSDFFEDTEEYDKIVTSAEDQVAKLEQGARSGGTVAASGETPGGSVPAATAGAAPARFHERRSRSRRARRNRLKGKRFDEVAAAPEPVAVADSVSPTPSEGLSVLPGESLAKYQGKEAASDDVAPPEDSEVIPSDDVDEVSRESEGITPGGVARLDLTADQQDAEEETGGEQEAVAEDPEEEVLTEEPLSLGSAESGSPQEETTTPSDLSQEIREALLDLAPSADAELGSSVSRVEGSTPITDSDIAQPPEPMETGDQDAVSKVPPEPLEKVEVPSETSTVTVEPASERKDAPHPASRAASAKAGFRSSPPPPRFFRKGQDRRRRSYEYAEDRKNGPSEASPYPLIGDLLKEGQEILVQVAKEPLGTKGARITSHIALPGRYLVYMPTVDHIGVSRKIDSDEERQRLKRIIQENRGRLSGGFIVRTAGQGRGEEEFKSDIQFLSALWAEIRSKSEKKSAPAIIHRDLSLVQRLLRDQLSADFSNIRVDNELEYSGIVEFINRFQPSLVGRVKLYSKDTPIFEDFGVQAEIDKALRSKVWLKSGGYIVIDQAEALVAIDVNTGKYVGKSNKLEDTIVKTNVEAAKEIARQVRLRDLGGIIVCDFIDMEDRKNRTKVMQALEEALRGDKSPSKILQFNDFGLVAITRKRVKQSLLKTLCEPCASCGGSGMVKSPQTVCYEIQAEVRKMASVLDNKEITIRANPEVAKALKTSEASVVSEIETTLKKDVIIKSDPLLQQERFDIF